MYPKYITIHNTGNSRESANAKMHTIYIDNNPNYVSWHLTIDGKEIYQELPLNEIGWHASTQKGNYESIGVEICEVNNYPQALKNAIQVIKLLMEYYHIPIENVVPHKYWNGKYCPRKILDDGWLLFLSEIERG